MKELNDQCAAMRKIGTVGNPTSIKDSQGVIYPVTNIVIDENEESQLSAQEKLQILLNAGNYAAVQLAIEALRYQAETATVTWMGTDRTNKPRQDSAVFRIPLSCEQPLWAALFELTLYNRSFTWKVSSIQVEFPHEVYLFTSKGELISKTFRFGESSSSILTYSLVDKIEYFSSYILTKESLKIEQLNPKLKLVDAVAQAKSEIEPLFYQLTGKYEYMVARFTIGDQALDYSYRITDNPVKLERFDLDE
jgi:hypothetical protein